jgi:DNA primase
MVLPEGKDPDDVIKEDPQEWQRLLEKAAPVVDYTFDLVVSKLDVTKARDKSQAVDQLLPLIAEIKHPVRRAHYLQKLSRAVAVDEQTLAAALGQFKPSKPGPRREAKPPSPTGLVSRLSSGDSLAEYCLYLLFTYPDLRSHASDVRMDFFLNTEDREIFVAWQNTADVNLLRESLDISLLEHLNTITSVATPPLQGEAQERALRQCINRLRERRLKDLKAKEQILISELDATDKPEGLQEIEKSAVKLNAELGEVFLHGKEKRKRASD